MKMNLQRDLQRLTCIERRKRYRRIIVTALTVVMVFCTAYALTLPAITLEHSCRIPEHQHTEKCFDPGIYCTYRVHRHTQDCNDGSGALVCGKADFVVHRHDAACCDESGKLWCSLPEIGTHTHSADCLAKPVEELQPETILKRETDAEPESEELPAAEAAQQNVEKTIEAVAAAETEQRSESVPVCGKPEIQLHEHTAACMDAAGALICEQMEVLEHPHSEVCLTQGGNELSCGQEEHNHAGDDTLELTEEKQVQIKAVEEQIAALPDVKRTQEKLKQAMENAAARALYRQVGETLAAARKSYDALTAEQKKAVSNAETLTMLEKAWAEVKAPTLETLQDDSAYVAELSVSTGALNVPEEATETHSVQYALNMRLSAYRAEDEYGAANVRIECVLPLSAKQAAFDLAQMPWLENAVVATENREWNGMMQSCQVLTGSYRLSGKDGAAVIPGEYTQPVVVAQQKAVSGVSFSLQISAALEQNAWDGDCAVHSTAEKRTVTTAPMIVRVELTEKEMQQICMQFTAEIETLEMTVAQEGGTLSDETAAAIETLRTRLETAFALGELTEESFAALAERLDALLGGDLNSIAEPAVGTNWILLRDSGWFEEYNGSACVMQEERIQMPSLAVAAQDGASSGVQVDEPGGKNRNDADSVAVSKTIAGTDLENVFDITLRVRTGQKIEETVREPDMAVVIVMDISNTMNSDFGGTTRYAAAMIAAEQFLDHFAENNSLGISKIGYVAFNTDAHKIFDLQACTNNSQANVLKNTMRTQTENIINAAGYGDSHSRFTNIEAGLKRAQDMLKGVNNKNKFIIFLSDGFPTTYISSGYSGYDPYDTSGVRFKDRVLNKPCSYGTSYSDEAAIRARITANSIKGNGTTIFSIGVDVGGQNIQQYITQSEKANGFSVMDRTGVNYEIGSAASTEAYKNWLCSSIGSGYYYDSTNAEGLKSAYDQIFQKIKETTQVGSEADWVASDPLPVSENVQEVEFISLYDKKRIQCGSKVSGTHDESTENTAEFVSEKNAIQWDLKNSGYTSQDAGGGKTVYTYELVYRVRLENEKSDFEEEKIYPTNDRTTLTYRIVSSTGVSDKKEIEFPIPAVHGYLGEMEFTKMDNRGNALPGAVFTLFHDDVKCSICRGDGKSSVSMPEQTATSDPEGKVSFTNIPSGHTYILKETTAPEGYAANGDTYQVVVAYDKLSVTVTHADSSAGEWNGSIVNNIYYELPATGGVGTLTFIAGGLLSTGAAALLLAKCARRRGKDRSSF